MKEINPAAERRHREKRAFNTERDKSPHDAKTRLPVPRQKEREQKRDADIGQPRKQPTQRPRQNIFGDIASNQKAKFLVGHQDRNNEEPRRDPKEIAVQRPPYRDIDCALPQRVRGGGDDRKRDQSAGKISGNTNANDEKDGVPTCIQAIKRTVRFVVR